MNKLKRLVVSLTLISALAAVAFAGETSPPPEPPPCVPGETHGPPCVAQPVNDDSADPGETLAPPAPDTTVDVTDITEAVMWALSLF